MVLYRVNFSVHARKFKFRRLDLFQRRRAPKQRMMRAMEAKISSGLKNHQVVARNSSAHRSWAIEATNQAERVLSIFEKEQLDDDRPRQAIEAIRAWAQG